MKKARTILAWILCIVMLSAALPLFGSAEEYPDFTGKIIEVEKYGHVVLDILIEDFNNSGYALGDIVTVSAGNFTGEMPYFNGYYVDQGEPMLRAYPGKDNLAVCINYGRFADEAGVDVGDEVSISLKEKAGALLLQEVSNLVYTNERDDYSSDAVFANFRPVVIGGIADGALYRSASPVDNTYNRAAYANALAEEAGVNAVMNLANTEEEIAADFAAEGFASDYYKSLYEEGHVIPLGLPINFTSPEFAEGSVKGLTFLAGQGTPYLVHCTEGTDRAGFASMILEALMGATQEEIIKDYMQSYINYYGIEAGTDKYDMIVEKNIVPMLRIAAGTDTPEDETLAEGVEAYLKENGMEQEALDALKAALAQGADNAAVLGGNAA